MARKGFEEVRAAFRESTGITLSGNDLERCKAVYEAEGNMLAVQKRTKPTRQNYGLYIEKLPDDRRFGHGTMDNQQKVSAFVDYCIGCRKDKKLPERQSEVAQLKAELAKQKKMNKGMFAKIVRSDCMTQQLIEAYNTIDKQAYKIARYEEFLRSHGVNPLNLPDNVDEQAQPSERFIQVETSGDWVEVSTGEVISDAEKQKRVKKLEQNNDNEIDEQ